MVQRYRLCKKSMQSCDTAIHQSGRKRLCGRVTRPCMYKFAVNIGYNLAIVSASLYEQVDESLFPIYSVKRGAKWQEC